jgi:hypothetical protein
MNKTILHIRMRNLGLGVKERLFVLACYFLLNSNLVL